ncbi:hypothetical protein Syun_009430 [Stephania yunnanensis]|uniref:DUF1365 domain-containing protein n=1 Tax=Stephania yunnanensis TaxID=152371 RepID=A0AAP0PSA2_9MAGN
MEALYLLFSATSTIATAFALSLRLLLRYFYSLILNRRQQEDEEVDDDRAGISLYEGTVWHERRSPVCHAFKYDVRYALVDLDRAHTNRALPSSFFANHLSAHEARRITSTTGPVFLLTIPASVGYEQNPLSVYYCYDVQLKKCIAEHIDEVTNTPWGERVSFTFDPELDLVAKPLHVSPFMDMLGYWRMRANTPGTNISLVISVHHPKLGDYFTATLTAKRVSSWTSTTELFFWLMPHKVALWVYLQALNLWWKNVQFLQHPRYHNHDYRELAELRDRKLRCSWVDGQDENGLCKPNCQNLQSSSGINDDRWFVWRDAQWPWK